MAIVSMHPGKRPTWHSRWLFVLRKSKLCKLFLQVCPGNAMALTQNQMLKAPHLCYLNKCFMQLLTVGPTWLRRCRTSMGVSQMHPGKLPDVEALRAAEPNKWRGWYSIVINASSGQRKAENIHLKEMKQIWNRWPRNRSDEKWKVF